jgi:hypothetical protein
MLLDNKIVYGEPRSVVMPGLRSFMKTYQIGVRKREANCSHVENYFVKALSVDHAFEVGNMIVGKKGYIVKDVISPGDELYGVDEECGCGYPDGRGGYFDGKYLNTLPEPAFIN